jgi:hypothetical protein
MGIIPICRKNNYICNTQSNNHKLKSALIRLVMFMVDALILLKKDQEEIMKIAIR